MSLAQGVHRIRLVFAADWLAVALVASLPWSTSATGVLVALWAVTLIPTLEWPAVRRELIGAAGGLPILLVSLGVVGMLWADVSLLDRWRGLDSFLKLLAIPLLLVQFRHSSRGTCALVAYLVSCVLLLLASSALFLTTMWLDDVNAVPVKNAATQSGEFVTCIFALLFVAIDFYRSGRRGAALGLAVLAVGFLANIFFVATGRTALVIMLVLLFLLGTMKFKAKGMALLIACGIAVGAVGFASSDYLRTRIIDVRSEITDYLSGETTSSGERIEFYKKSLGFIESAPLIGHGTGEMVELFRRAAVGQSGAGATATTNPHNQTFAVGIQLGAVGVAVLWAMWIAHLILFRGEGWPAWVGLAVVVQNIVGSLFNSHIFDFLQGWTYVLGVGIAGGIVLRRLDAKDARPATGVVPQ